MPRRWYVCLLLFSSCAALVFAKSKPAPTLQKNVIVKLPITTSSPQARNRSLENALRRFKRKVQQEDIIKEVKRHSFT